MIDLKRFAGSAVVVQFKTTEKWFVWTAPTKQSREVYPELLRAPDDSGNPVPVPMPFLQGKVTADGDLEVYTGSGGKLLVSVAFETIASVTQLLEPSTPEERSNLIVPGN